MQNLTQAREELIAQRAALDEQLAALDTALSAMGRRPMPVRPAAGGPALRAGERRPRGVATGRRSGSLKEHIARVLSATGGPMAVKDITEGVRRGGYETRNKTLAKSVGIALTQMPEVDKVGRGLFRLK
ncbi:MAG: hypothetical protein GX547_07310 [Phycisphaerae bacterium]|nr:hypothetical protein [Phycisphaerae bacterium]